MAGLTMSANNLEAADHDLQMISLLTTQTSPSPVKGFCKKINYAKCHCAIEYGLFCLK